MSGAISVSAEAAVRHLRAGEAYRPALCTATRCEAVIGIVATLQ